MSAFEMDAARDNRKMDSRQLTDITPFLTGIDAKNRMREQRVKSLVSRREQLTKLIKECKESGPLMRSLCKEFTALKKKIQILGGA